MRGGDEIVVDPAPSVDSDLLRMFILGPVMATLLRQRGLAVLHASSVSVNSAAVTFLGASGMGKSTLAAALHARGFQFVADDAVALEVNLSTFPMVLPAFPQLKLWPDSAAALGIHPDTLPRLDPQREKRAHSVHRGFVDAPPTLRRFYVIADGAEPMVEVLRPQEALLELLRHAYGARSLRAVKPAEHFMQFGAVATGVPARRLRFPRSMSSLAEVVRLVEGDFAGLA